MKEKTAKLLFSQKFDESGNPEGIGLSLWRVNLGGGSLEGDESPIKFPWRGARTFLDKNGKIDMSRCKGLRYFMGKSKEYDCEIFLLFTNTPPDFDDEKFHVPQDGIGLSFKPQKQAACADSVKMSTTRSF